MLPDNPFALEPIRRLAAPKKLDQWLFTNIRELSDYRVWLDRIIIEWAGSLTETGLDHTLNYTSMKGASADKNFHGLVHFFNHQTHHRGQVTTFLAQAGVDVGDTDLVALIPSGSGK